MHLNDIAREAHETAKSKGLYDDEPPLSAELLALIHSEVSEVLEAVRDDAWDLTFRDDGKPEGVPSELADVIIRVCGMAAYYGIDLDSAVGHKMAYNKTRPHKHGRNVF